MRRLLRRLYGFNLAEVLIALALLTTAFLVVVGIFVPTLQLQTRTAEITEAAEIAKTVMEGLKAQPGLVPDPTKSFFTTADIIVGPPPFPPAPFPQIQGEYGTYDIEIHITESPATPDLKAVEVIVKWEGGQGTRIQTLFAE